MTLNNQFTNNQLDVFRNAGFNVYEDYENGIISIVKYPKIDPYPSILIQIDYAFRQLTIIEQNILNFRESKPPKYCAALPDSIADTIKVLELTKTIKKPLLAKLWTS